MTYRDIHRYRSIGYRVHKVVGCIYLVSIYSKDAYDGNLVSSIIKRLLSHVYTIKVLERW